MRRRLADFPKEEGKSNVPRTLGVPDALRAPGAHRGPARSAGGRRCRNNCPSLLSRACGSAPQAVAYDTKTARVRARISTPLTAHVRRRTADPLRNASGRNRVMVRCCFVKVAYDEHIDVAPFASTNASKLAAAVPASEATATEASGTPMRRTRSGARSQPRVEQGSRNSPGSPWPCPGGGQAWCLGGRWRRAAHRLPTARHYRSSWIWSRHGTLHCVCAPRSRRELQHSASVVLPSARQPGGRAQPGSCGRHSVWMGGVRRRDVSTPSLSRYGALGCPSSPLTHSPVLSVCAPGSEGQRLRAALRTY